MVFAEVEQLLVLEALTSNYLKSPIKWLWVACEVYQACLAAKEEYLEAKALNHEDHAEETSHPWAVYQALETSSQISVQATMLSTSQNMAKVVALVEESEVASAHHPLAASEEWVDYLVASAAVPT